MASTSPIHGAAHGVAASGDVETLTSAVSVDALISNNSVDTTHDTINVQGPLSSLFTDINVESNNTTDLTSGPQASVT